MDIQQLIYSQMHFKSKFEMFAIDVWEFNSHISLHLVF